MPNPFDPEVTQCFPAVSQKETTSESFAGTRHLAPVEQARLVSERNESRTDGLPVIADDVHRGACSAIQSYDGSEPINDVGVGRCKLLQKSHVCF